MFSEMTKSLETKEESHLGPHLRPLQTNNLLRHKIMNLIKVLKVMMLQ